MSDSFEDTPLEDRASNRRGFFRDGLASLLGPLADVLEAKLNAVREVATDGEDDPCPLGEKTVSSIRDEPIASESCGTAPE